MKTFFILIQFALFFNCQAQLEKFYSINDSFLFIKRKIPMDGQFKIIQNNREQLIKDNFLGNFKILNNNYFYCYNNNLKSDCICYRDNSFNFFRHFNADSFKLAESKNLNVSLDNLQLHFFKGNDTICLIYLISFNYLEHKKKHFVYQYNLKSGKIENLLYSCIANSFELGNDPISSDFKMGFIIREDYHTTQKLIIYDLKERKIEKEIIGVTSFSFAKDTNIFVASINSRSLEIYRTDGELMGKNFNIGKYSISEINWLSNECIYVKIKRNRKIGERYKMRYLIFNPYKFKYKKFKHKKDESIYL